MARDADIPRGGRGGPRRTYSGTRSRRPRCEQSKDCENADTPRQGWQGTCVPGRLRRGRDVSRTERPGAPNAPRPGRGYFDDGRTQNAQELALVGRAAGDATTPAVIALDDQDAEAAFIADVCARAPGDVAVLYRTNAQSRAVERELLKAGVKYQLLHARGFFDRKEVRDTLA